MSGICGILHRDQVPVERAVLQRMADAARHRGPDGIHMYVDGPVGLAHLALHITPESVHERQPLLSLREALALVFDGRIDNRAELIEKLEDTVPVHPKATDSEIILAAYKHWEQRCPEYIIGDYAFAIVHLAGPRLFAARSPDGWRTFHYYADQQGIFFASEANQLLCIPRFEIRLNEEVIAQDLAKPGFGGQSDSYYCNIYKLAPGESLYWDRGTTIRKKFWDLRPDTELRYTNEIEYAENFLELFKMAVRCRLRSIWPVRVFLSGGLDSTSIAAVAAGESLGYKSELAPILQAITFVSERMPLTAEVNRSQAVTEKWHINHQLLPVEQIPLLPQLSGNLAIHRDEPYFTTFSTFMAEAMGAQNSHPALYMTGLHGDAVTGVGNPFYYQKLLIEGKFNGFVDTIRTDSRQLGVAPTWILLRYILEPYWIAPLRRRLRFIRPLLKGQKVYIPPWINRDLVKTTFLEQWLLEQRKITDGFSIGRWHDVDNQAIQWRHHLLTEPTQARISAHLQNVASRFGMEFCDPWSDIRLVVFALSIPQELLTPGTNRKLLVRQALREYLPQSVRENLRLKTGPEVWVRKRFREQEVAQYVTYLKQDSLAQLRGYVDMHRLYQEYKLIQKGSHNFSFSLWNALCLEIWLRSNQL